MTGFKYKRPDLDVRRDNRLLMHTFRNFIAMPFVIHNLFFNGLSQDACRKVINRLEKNGYLVRYPLIGSQTYLRLGPKAVSRWQFPRSRSHKLGGQRLPYELGCMYYTCIEGQPRKRLLPHELKKHHSWFPDSLQQSAYLQDGEQLATIRVEPRCTPERVISKLGEQLYRYSEIPEFRTLIDCDGFYFVVVMASEAQADAVAHQAIEQQLAVDVRTAVYPELMHFI